MPLDHLCYGVDICVGEVRILECEICPQGEEDLVCLVVARIGLHAGHQEVDVASVVNRPPLEMCIHVVVILLVYPHVNTAPALVHLMSNVSEHAFLGAGFRPVRPLKNWLPDELELLPLLTSLFFEVADTPKEEAVEPEFLKELGCARAVPEGVHQPGDLGRRDIQLGC